MSDMPSDFWSGWIIVITVLSFAALAWLVSSVYFSPRETTKAERPTWDENLRKGSNPAPLWWFWFILALMVFTVLYLILYPGLGSFKGALVWSQGGQLQRSEQRFETEFGGIRSLIVEARLETLQSDNALMQSAQRVFDRECAVCHGYQARGQADLFPSLVDDEWQWGGTPEQIEASIRQGRKAAMVGWSQLLGGEDGVRNVADYVKVLGTDTANGHAGQALYNTFCVACHLADGSGNVMLGAPSLVDGVWLYGDSDAALYESIANGRTGEMPAFDARLDDTQIRLLVALLTRTQSAD